MNNSVQLNTVYEAGDVLLSAPGQRTEGTKEKIHSDRTAIDTHAPLDIWIGRHWAMDLGVPRSTSPDRSVSGHQLDHQLDDQLDRIRELPRALPDEMRDPMPCVAIEPSQGTSPPRYVFRKFPEPSYAKDCDAAEATRIVEELINSIKRLEEHPHEWTENDAREVLTRLGVFFNLSNYSLTLISEDMVVYVVDMIGDVSDVTDIRDRLALRAANAGFGVSSHFNSAITDKPRDMYNKGGDPFILDGINPEFIDRSLRNIKDKRYDGIDIDKDVYEVLICLLMINRELIPDNDTFTKIEHFYQDLYVGAGTSFTLEDSLKGLTNFNIRHLGYGGPIRDFGQSIICQSLGRLFQTHGRDIDAAFGKDRRQYNWRYNSICGPSRKFNDIRKDLGYLANCKSLLHGIRNFKPEWLRKSTTTNYKKKNYQSKRTQTPLRKESRKDQLHSSLL